MQNNSKKILAILLVLVMAFATLALVACDSDEEFVNPTMPESSEVTSNGGTAVGYGDYIYYVNGTTIAASLDSGYTGLTKYGDIVRISVADLDSLIEIDENDAEDADAEDLETYLYELVEEYVEVVVPYIYYTGNTTDLTVNGIYIFNDRLYYTTPNQKLTNNGDSQTSQSVICSVALDGTDMVEHYIVTDNTVAIQLAEVDDSVYATFVLYNDDDEQDELTTVDLSTGTATVVATAMASYQFNGNNTYYITETGDIAMLIAGGEEEILVTNPDEAVYTSYTIASVNEGKVYYTVTENSTNNKLYMVTSGSEPVVVLDSTVDASSTAYTYLGYGSGVIMTSTIKDYDVTAYQLYVTSGDISSMEFIIPVNTNDTAVTLVSVEGDVLTYGIAGIYYTVDLSADSYELVEIGPSIDPGASTAWYGEDVVGDYVFVQDSYYCVLAYKVELDEDGEWESYYVDITRLDIEEEDED